MRLAPPHTKKGASITATLYVYIQLAVMDALIKSKPYMLGTLPCSRQGVMKQTLEISPTLIVQLETRKDVMQQGLDNAYASPTRS